jgi:hypothetical protein
MWAIAPRRPRSVEVRSYGQLSIECGLWLAVAVAVYLMRGLERGQVVEEVALAIVGGVVVGAITVVAVYRYLRYLGHLRSHADRLAGRR